MIGNQIPRFRIEPKRSGTDGGDAALLMEKYAYKLDDWQRLMFILYSSNAIFVTHDLVILTARTIRR